MQFRHRLRGRDRDWQESWLRSVEYRGLPPGDYSFEMSARVVEAVAGVCESLGFGVPLVVDPVMVAKGGARLLDKGALDALILRLLPLASLLTPNVPEAEILTGMSIKTPRDLERAAESFVAAAL